MLQEVIEKYGKGDRLEALVMIEQYFSQLTKLHQRSDIELVVLKMRILNELGHYRKFLKFYAFLETHLSSKFFGDNIDVAFYAPLVRATMFLEYAYAFLRMHRLESIQEKLDDAEVLLNSICNLTDPLCTLLRARVARYRGIYYLVTGQLDKAETFFMNGLRLLEADLPALGVPGMADYGHCLNNLGVLETYRGNARKALYWQQEALRTREELGDFSGLGLSMANLGETFLVLGQISLARNYLESGISLLERYGNPENLAKELYSLLKALLYLGDLDKANKVLLKLRRLRSTREKESLYLEDVYQLALAQVLRTAPRVKAMVEAQRIFSDFLKREDTHAELRMEAILGLIELLMFEYIATESVSALNDLLEVIAKLEAIGEQLSSQLIPIRAKWILAKVKLVMLREIPTALDLLDEALKMAETVDLKLLQEKISLEIKELVYNKKRIEEILSFPLDERAKLLRVNDPVTPVWLHIPRDEESLPSFDPQRVLVLNKDFRVMTSLVIGDDDLVNEELLVHFVQAMVTSSNQVFSEQEDFELFKHGEINVLIREIFGFLFVFIFKGENLDKAYEWAVQVQNLVENQLSQISAGFGENKRDEGRDAGGFYQQQILEILEDLVNSLNLK